MTECDHWMDIGREHFGRCGADHHGGFPSRGVCGSCQFRVVGGVNVAIPPAVTIDGGSDLPPIPVTGKLRRAVSRMAAYASAELSNVFSLPLSSGAIEQRVSACKSCVKLVSSLDGRTDSGGIGFCAGCGCGGRKRAALSVKIKMPKATCPLGRWGISGSREKVG